MEAPSQLRSARDLSFVAVLLVLPGEMFSFCHFVASSTQYRMLQSRTAFVRETSSLLDLKLVCLLVGTLLERGTDEVPRTHMWDEAGRTRARQRCGVEEGAWPGSQEPCFCFKSGELCLSRARPRGHHGGAALRLPVAHCPPSPSSPPAAAHPVHPNSAFTLVILFRLLHLFHLKSTSQCTFL